MTLCAHHARRVIPGTGCEQGGDDVAFATPKHIILLSKAVPRKRVCLGCIREHGLKCAPYVLPFTRHLFSFLLYLEPFT